MARAGGDLGMLVDLVSAWVIGRSHGDVANCQGRTTIDAKNQVVEVAAVIVSGDPQRIRQPRIGQRYEAKERHYEDDSAGHAATP